MDFTFVCPTEIAEFGRRKRDFRRPRRPGARASAPTRTSSTWPGGRSHPDLRDLPFPMLADTKRELSTALGVLHKTDGVRAARHVHRRSRRASSATSSVNDLWVGRNVDEVLRVLDALQTDELCPCNWQKGEPTLEVGVSDVAPSRDAARRAARSRARTSS